MKPAVFILLFFIGHLSNCQVHASCNCFGLNFENGNRFIRCSVKQPCILVGKYKLIQGFIDTSTLGPFCHFEKNDSLWVAQDTSRGNIEIYDLTKKGFSNQSFKIIEQENHGFSQATFLLKCNEYDFYAPLNYKTGYTDRYLAIFNDSSAMFYKMKVIDLKEREEFPSLLLYLKK